MLESCANSAQVKRHMKFLFIAHGCLLVESHSTRVLTDPWLEGPCFYASGWHYPLPSHTVSTLPDVDYIYITHEHQDHFHPESLQKFDRAIPVLISKFMIDRFAKKLRALGFQKVIEVDHGRRFELAPGFYLTPYQVRADDSAIILQDEEATLLNMNDVVMKRRELARLLRRHPQIDVLLKKFVESDTYPYCYESEDGEDLGKYDSRETVRQFVADARFIRPRYIIPFAGMGVFLGEDSMPFNQYLISPLVALEALAQAGVAVEGVLMNPGDSWSSTDGFHLNGAMPYDNKEARLHELWLMRREEVERRRQAEHPVPDLFFDFERYFRRFLRRCPFFAKRQLKGLRVYFEVTDLNEYWYLDFGSERIENHRAPEADYDARINITSWLLAQAVRHQAGWAEVLFTMRPRIRLKARARAKELKLWFYLILDDMQYLQLRNWLTLRALRVAFLRRHEFVSYFLEALAGKFFRTRVEAKYTEP